MRITKGSTHDLDPIKTGLLDDLKGLCWADGGYVSAQTKQNLVPQGLVFRAKPRKNMVNELAIFNEHHRKAYRQRQVVEGVFSQLKGTFGLIQKTARKASSLFAHVFAALASRACAQKEIALAKENL